jgi:hypothetical protein
MRKFWIDAAGVSKMVNRRMQCTGAARLPSAMTTPRKPKNVREICGTNACALLCRLVRNEYNGRHATIFKKSAV